MTPEAIIEELKAESEFTEDENKALAALGETTAYKVAVSAMTRMILTCGDYALEQGSLPDYWRGVKQGLNLFFDLTNGAQLTSKDLIAQALYAEANNEPEDEDDIDVTQAISSAIGNSPL